jgi:hypothetical protein
MDETVRMSIIIIVVLFFVVCLSRWCDNFCCRVAEIRLTLFCTMAHNVWGVISMALAVCHASVAQNLEVASRFLRNLWTPHLVQLCLHLRRYSQGEGDVFYLTMLLVAETVQCLLV